MSVDAARIKLVQINRDLWRSRAADRLIQLKVAEDRIRELEGANASLVVQVQTWRAKYESLIKLLAIKQKNIKGLQGIIRKIRGCGEA
jgi:hypothetical protein